MPSLENIISLIEEKHLKNLIFIQTEILKRGKISYLIGGSVRDLVMGKVPKDFDLTTSMYPGEVKTLFKRVIDTGIKHGTVTILIGENSYEITTFRKDQGYSDGRHPDTIEFGNTLEEDVLRRDFTINSIALDLINNNLIDLQNGLEDIKNKNIKTIGSPIERFTEDGLRPIRCIRFMTILGFKIDENTYLALEKTKHITKKISTERFHDELLKILNSEFPENGMFELSKVGYFSLFWKLDISENLYNDANKNLGRLSKNPISVRISYLFFVILFNKNVDSKKLEQLFKNLKFSNEIIKFSLYYYNIIYKLIDKNFTKELNSNSSLTLRKLLSEFSINTGEKVEINNYTNGLLSLSFILLTMSDLFLFKDEFINIMNTNPPLTLKELKISGIDLKENFPELNNREYGNILKKCLSYIIEFPHFNKKESLINYIKNS